MLGIFRFFSLFLHDLFTLASVFSAFTGVVSWRLLFSAFPLIVEGGVVGVREVEENYEKQKLCPQSCLEFDVISLVNNRGYFGK